MGTDNNKDEFIRKLMALQPEDKAPEGFTARVMQKVQPEAAPEAGHYLSPLAWAGIFVGVAILIITMFFVDIPFLNNFFSSTGIEKISLDIFNGGLIDSFVKFFKQLNINAIGIAIIIGFVSLILLERLFSRRRSESRLILL